MLPGFRFLFAAIMLSMSLMIFGLGAASLLRSAHEEFASNPSWRAAPDVKFAQPSEATMPVLATLRLDVRQEPPPQEDASPAPEVTGSPPPAADQLAASRAEPSSPPEIAKPEATVPTSTGVEVPVADDHATAIEAAPLSTQTVPPQKSAAAEGTTDQPSQESAQESAQESGQGSGQGIRQELAQPSIVAAIAPDEPPPHRDLPLGVAPEPDALESAAPAESPVNPASTRIATLGGPPVDIVGPARAKAGETKPDEDANKKRAEAQRAAKRRRIAAARARLAAQQAQQLGPFFQPSTPAPRAQ